ncbi:addiction module antitoxin [Paramesorhizobium deserti]|uniref:Addiction module antitoxin n=1 Tax=Paramesorhizobium deserti TaxID=1494590 RepID=A0A135I0J2_9HYPH|nr:type II toxin-antitoxin system ParD family antitoxin [Paramesorhizobium deserti]KXF78959.1 addiction module antitoxin [Paramesorhizobium deserti]
MAISADLGKPLEDYVEELVKSGRYRSRSEVLREGIRLVQEREMKARALDALIKEALEDVEAGRTRPAEEVFSELRAELKAMGAKRAG